MIMQTVAQFIIHDAWSFRDIACYVPRTYARPDVPLPNGTTALPYNWIIQLENGYHTPYMELKREILANFRDENETAHNKTTADLVRKNFLVPGLTREEAEKVLVELVNIAVDAGWSKELTNRIAQTIGNGRTLIKRFGPDYENALEKAWTNKTRESRKIGPRRSEPSGAKTGDSKSEGDGQEGQVAIPEQTVQARRLASYLWVYYPPNPTEKELPDYTKTIPQTLEQFRKDLEGVGKERTKKSVDHHKASKALRKAKKPPTPPTTTWEYDEKVGKLVEKAMGKGRRSQENLNIAMQRKEAEEGRLSPIQSSGAEISEHSSGQEESSSGARRSTREGKQGRK